MHPDVMDRADRATLVVGRGRGFVVEGADGRLVITAARCLPSRMEVSFTHEHLYPNLLAPLRKEERVWAECLFADPVGDLAVLGPPRGEALAAELRDYEALVESGGALRIARPQDDTSAWLMERDRGWFQCTIGYPGRGPLMVRDAADALKGTMPGARIVSDAGLAIGVVASGGDHGGDAQQPALTDNLPGWLLRDVPIVTRRRSGPRPKSRAARVTPNAENEGRR